MNRIASQSDLHSGRKRRVGRVWLLALLGLVAIAAAACGSGSSSGSSVAEDDANGQSSTVGNAPAIDGDTFSHGRFSLELNTGKPVLVNFWFPSCPPCRAEMPDLQAAYEKYGDDVAFIGVQQLGLDSPEDGEAFLSELQITYPNMPDIGSTVQFGYEVFSFPTTVFLDKNHDIARVWTGIIGAEQLEEQLSALLAS